MHHTDFVSRMATALQQKHEGRPNDAASALRTLLHDITADVKDGVNEWHQQQALGLLVDALDAAGEDDKCRAAWEELLQFTAHNATYWEQARDSARADFDRWRTERPET